MIQSTQPIGPGRHFGRERIRPDFASLPQPADQEPLPDFVARIQAQGVEAFAKRILANRQRSSSKNGILKAEAAQYFAECLTKRGSRTFQDLEAFRDDASLEAAVRAIPGQKSGVSWRYFWMLAGDDAGVKPDRMILGFLAERLGRPVSLDQAVSIVRALCRHPLLAPFDLSPRRLDHAIWNWQRSRGR